MVIRLQRHLRQGTVKRRMLCLISSMALSLWWHVGLLRLLLRSMRRAAATEPATIGHGGLFVGGRLARCCAAVG